MSDNINIKKVDFTATFETLGTLLFWTLGPIFITYLSSDIDSYTQNFLRYLTACLFLIPFLLFSIRKNNFDKSIWIKALFPAAANLTMQSLYAKGFYYLSPGFLILLLKLNIVWTAIFSLIFFHDEKPLAKSKRFWLGMILSAIGVFGVMYFKKGFAETKTITGIIIAIGAGLAFAAYAISARIAFRKTDSIQAFTVTSIYTTIGLAILAFSLGNIKASGMLNTWQWVCIVFSGITGIAFGHPLYYAAMKRIGATIPSLILLAQPFTVLAMSYVIFKETMNISQLFSGIVLLSGSAIAIWAQQHIKK